MNFDAVTFCTPDYEQYAADWEEMIRQLGGRPTVIRLKSAGTWARNCGLKPAAILKAMDTIPGWFIYLDIDVPLTVPPVPPAVTHWDVGTTENLVKEHVNRISAACLLFNHTPGARKFVSEWERRCRATGGIDHPRMTAVIRDPAINRQVRIVDVSGTLSWIPNGLRGGAHPPAPEPKVSAPDGTVWYAIPCIRPSAEAMKALHQWRAMGYKVAVQRDPGAEELPVDMCVVRPYQGYAEAVNHLARAILSQNDDAQWIVTGGDDMYPDPKLSAKAIAAECTAHFKGTLGVMQPTGDRHLPDPKGVCAADRICVSPWMGREWCLRAYEGRGPLHEGYFHCFVDEELHEVATSADLLWHRRDITQHHAWWSREKQPRPQHLDPVRIKWDKDKALFHSRKKAGFPGASMRSIPTPIYIGYYTPGDYEKDARTLTESLDAIGLPHDLINIGTGGTWQEITQRKAIIVKEAMIKHAGRPVVYLDVDCLVIRKPPMLYGLNCDVAAALFGGKVLCSGTVYFGPTKKAMEVVDRWIQINAQYPTHLPDGRDAWDQRTLQMAINQVKCNFTPLPPEYTYMVGLSQKKYPEVHPIILHTRGSLRHNPEHE